MIMPGYTAEASLYGKRGRYRTELGVRPEADAGAPRGDLLYPQAMHAAAMAGSSAGFSRASLGFTCGRGGCVCSGDMDCNDMFTTNVCGPNAVCFNLGGQVICVCSR
jgi:hypothetical protein